LFKQNPLDFGGPSTRAELGAGLSRTETLFLVRGFVFYGKIKNERSIM